MRQSIHLASEHSITGMLAKVPRATHFLVLMMREAKERFWLRSSWCKG